MIQKHKTLSGFDVIRLNSFKNERKIQPKIKFNLTVKGCSLEDKSQLIISKVLKKRWTTQWISFTLTRFVLKWKNLKPKLSLFLELFKVVSPQDISAAHPILVTLYRVQLWKYQSVWSGAVNTFNSDFAAADAASAAAVDGPHHVSRFRRTSFATLTTPMSTPTQPSESTVDDNDDDDSPRRPQHFDTFRAANSSSHCACWS